MPRNLLAANFDSIADLRRGPKQAIDSLFADFSVPNHTITDLKKRGFVLLFGLKVIGLRASRS